MQQKKKKNKERICVDGKWYRKLKSGKLGVELTRCNNTMSEAEFFAFILSHCRRLTYKWQPATTKLNEGRRPYTGADKRVKWEYNCECCGVWDRKATKNYRQGIQIDHIIPCGGINRFEVISTWFERALCEKDGFQRLCGECHNKKTRDEKK